MVLGVCFLLELAVDHAVLVGLFPPVCGAGSFPTPTGVLTTRPLHCVWVSVLLLYAVGGVVVVAAVLRCLGPVVFSPLGFVFVLDLPVLVLWGFSTAVLVVFVVAVVDNPVRNSSSPTSSSFYFRYEEVFIFYVLQTVALFAFACRDLLVLFICLEIATFAFFALVGMPGGGSARTHATSASRLAEVAVRYLLPNLLASLLILFGVLLLYLSTGHLQVVAVRALLLTDAAPSAGWSVVALALLCGGFLLKLGAVPFHSWALWVYEAAPPHLVCFLSTFAKVFYSAIFFKFVFPFVLHAPAASALLLVGGLLSVAWASVFGLYELRLYPLLAYSGILNAGYGLCAASLCSRHGASVGFLIFLVYSFLLLGVFAVLFRTVPLTSKGYPMRLVSHLQAIATANPVAVWAFSVLVFALIGVPPLIGFYPKALIFFHLALQTSWTVSAFFLVGVVVSAFFYLRWVVYLLRGFVALPRYSRVGRVKPGVGLAGRPKRGLASSGGVAAALALVLVGCASLPATADALLVLSQLALIVTPVDG